MSKGTVEKYALLFVVCGIVFAANYAQYQVSGLAHLVVSDLHLTSAEFSAVLFAPFVPAVVFGMPVGVLRRSIWREGARNSSHRRFLQLQRLLARSAHRLRRCSQRPCFWARHHAS